MTHTIQPAVLVVGAGPTGLTLAATLRHFGVPVRIVDRAAQPTLVSKALAVWSGSLEALQGLGVVEEFLAAGTRLKALSVGVGGRVLADMAVGDGIDSPYPFPLLLPQSRTEEILTARLAGLGTVVERGLELAGLVQDADGVTATLSRGDGTTETIRSRYLVGCDGARSSTRHALGVAFEGYTEPETFLLGDVLIDGGGLDHRSIHLRWKNRGAIALFPFEDSVWRVFASRGRSPDDAPPTVDELQAHIDRHGPPGLRLHSPRWLSAFRINERLAARYRVGRCFLAGDAAHIHSPAGGQGMNTGIQDATNLGWKLAYALHGHGAAETLLDSYEPERRPVARAVIDGSAQRLHLAFSESPFVIALKSAAVAVLGNLPAVQKKLQVQLSETDIVYRDGPLVALGAPPAKPKRTETGARARDAAIRDPLTGVEATLWPRLSELRHTLLVFEDGAGGTPFDPAMLERLTGCTGDRLAILRLDTRSDPRGAARARYGLDGPGWVLVRPDQVVAARGGGGDHALLDRYLDRAVRTTGSLEAAPEGGARYAAAAPATTVV